MVTGVPGAHGHRVHQDVVMATVDVIVNAANRNLCLVEIVAWESLLKCFHAGQVFVKMVFLINFLYFYLPFLLSKVK